MRVCCESEMENVMRASILRLVMLLLLTASAPGCEGTETVDVTALFWEAWENPETLDTKLASMQVPERASECLRQLADAMFAAADAQVLEECRHLLSRSPAWNECHEEVEAKELRGQIYRDIAAALEGSSFASSPGGAQLVITKSLDPATWVQATAVLRENTGPIACELDA